MTHFLAWCRFDIAGKISALEGYYSMQTTLRNRAQPGDDLWLLTSMRYRGRIIAPALIGRFKISQLSHDDSRGTILVPDKSMSHYFPMNNIYDLLQSLEFAGAASSFDPSNCPHCHKAMVAGNRYSSVGLHFMATRTLHERSIYRLENFYEKVLSSKPIFISYRWADQPDYAVGLVEALIERNVTVWWDKWMVTLLTTIEGSEIPKEKLRSTLNDGIERSRVFVALLTSSYSESEWTNHEWQTAINNLDAMHMVAVGLGGSIDMNELSIHRQDAKTPSRLAEYLQTLI